MERFRVNSIDLYTHRNSNCGDCPINGVLNKMDSWILDESGLTFELVKRLCEGQAGLSLNTDFYLSLANVNAPEWYLEDIELFIAILDCKQDLERQGLEEERCGSIMIKKHTYPLSSTQRKDIDNIKVSWFEVMKRSQKAS